MAQRVRRTYPRIPLVIPPSKAGEIFDYSTTPTTFGRVRIGEGRVRTPSYVYDDFMPEIKAWLKENMRVHSRIRIRFVHNKETLMMERTIFFACDADAVLFKLRWL